MSRQREAGFSLIEMLVAVSILMILSGLLFLGTNSARKKETEKYVNALSNQIRLLQTTSMSMSGKWRLGLYLKDKKYYCVLESEKNTGPESGRVIWEVRSEKTMLGRTGAVDYNLVSVESGEGSGDGEAKQESAPHESDDEKGNLIHIWRFDSDTGSCIEGAGTMAVTGIDRTRYLTVYRENGRCEIDDSLEKGE